MILVFLNGALAVFVCVVCHVALKKLLIKVVSVVILDRLSSPLREAVAAGLLYTVSLRHDGLNVDVKEVVSDWRDDLENPRNGNILLKVSFCNVFI